MDTPVTLRPDGNTSFTGVAPDCPAFLALPAAIAAGATAAAVPDGSTWSGFPLEAAAVEVNSPAASPIDLPDGATPIAAADGPITVPRLDLHGSSEDPSEAMSRCDSCSSGGLDRDARALRIARI